MPDDTRHGASCSEFDALLSEALEGTINEGTLTGAQKASFDAHRQTCQVCGPLFADAAAGRDFLRQLQPVEPPQYLVHNILVATSGVVSKRPVLAGASGTPRRERLREWWDSWFAPIAAFVRQPRFAMSFAMIFFSASLGLNAAGVKASDVAHIDLRPSALRHAYNDAQIKVVKYYDNIRVVYEIESTMRQLKRASEPAEPAPQQQKDNRKNDTSGQPEQRQDRNYSSERSGIVLANFSEQNALRLHVAPSFELRASSGQEQAHGSRLVTRSSRRFV